MHGAGRLAEVSGEAGVAEESVGAGAIASGWLGEAETAGEIGLGRGHFYISEGWD